MPKTVEAENLDDLQIANFGSDDEGSVDTSGFETDIPVEENEEENVLISSEKQSLLGLIQQAAVSPVGDPNRHFIFRKLARQFAASEKHPEHNWKKMEGSIKTILRGIHVDSTEAKITKLFKKFQNEVQEIRIEIKKRLKDLASDVTKYVCYGIGSASPHPNARRYLECSEDLKDFQEYCRSYNYFLGSMVELGSAPSIDQVVNRIRFCITAALEVAANPVIYYTGHADENGDWWFYDGDISLKMVLEVFREVKLDFPDSSSTLYIVADCCYSGQWCFDLEEPNVVMIAAAAESEYSYDRTFSKLFFKGSFLQEKEINKLRKPELQTKIVELSPVKNSSIAQGKVAELKEELKSIVDKQQAKLLARAMKCRPMSATNGLVIHSLKQSELASKYWFHYGNSPQKEKF